MNKNEMPNQTIVDKYTIIIEQGNMFGLDTILRTNLLKKINL